MLTGLPSPRWYPNLLERLGVFHKYRGPARMLACEKRKSCQAENFLQIEAEKFKGICLITEVALLSSFLYWRQLSCEQLWLSLWGRR